MKRPSPTKPGACPRAALRADPWGLGPPSPTRTGEGAEGGAYIAAMRAARRLASGVAGSGAGAGWIFLVERGNVQSHSSAPI
jgi:hypothetical protein